MKNMKYGIFSLAMVLFLAACSTSGDKSQESSKPVEDKSPIKLIAPEDTSMLTANCKKYIDDMREQEKDLDDPFKYNDLYELDESDKFIEGSAVNIDEESNKRNPRIAEEDRVYLDKGDPEGKNQSRGTIPNRSDRNTGIELKFNVEEGFEAEEYKVLVADNEDFDNAVELVAKNNQANIDNLFVNTEYYWKVVADDNEESAVGTFTTGDYPRWISARPLYNVRDNGGYMTYSGKRVKQGLVYRGGEITSTSTSGHYNTIAESSKQVFRDVMKIGFELDLRGSGDIYDGYKACAFAEDGDIEYEMHAIKSYEETFTRTRSEVAPIFEILKNADKKPVYYHCFGGADRTGTLGFLLNGVLGVSYTDLVIDFELTSYSSIDNEHIRCHIPGFQHSYDRWPALINQLKTDTTGGYAWDDDALLMDNIENFLVKACNVPQATIDTIRDIMLED